MKSILYIVNKAQYSTCRYQNLKKLLATAINKSDKVGLALIEDAVSLVTGELKEEILELAEKGLKIYALQEDIEARGLATLVPPEKIRIVNYRQLINLIISDYEHIINYN
ncbi:MAG: DsrH/TusB family sulfur metabolism protein [Candidatus Odinarchaeia archaeon]